MENFLMKCKQKKEMKSEAYIIVIIRYFVILFNLL